MAKEKGPGSLPMAGWTRVTLSEERLSKGGGCDLCLVGLPSRRYPTNILNNIKDDVRLHIKAVFVKAKHVRLCNHQKIS